MFEVDKVAMEHLEPTEEELKFLRKAKYEYLRYSRPLKAIKLKASSRSPTHDKFF